MIFIQAISMVIQKTVQNFYVATKHISFHCILKYNRHDNDQWNQKTNRSYSF